MVARRFVSATLESWGLGDTDLLDCVRLLTSELVTNTVVHARSPAVLELARAARVIRIEVRDGAVVHPRVRAAGPWAASGRGLALVDALALRWGSFDADDGDKIVWFEIPAPPLD